MSIFLKFLEEILLNVAILLAAAAIFNILRRPAAPRHGDPVPWKQGLAFGVAAMITMCFPVTIAAGIFFDCRSSVVGVAALLGGPVAALVAVPLPILYRLLLGGQGTIPGVFEIVVPAMLGLLCHTWVRRHGMALTRRVLLWSGLVTIVGTNVIAITVVLLAVPESVVHFHWRLLPLIMGFSVAAFHFLGAMILVDRRRFQTVTALADSERRLDITLNSIGDAVIVCDRDGRVVRINPVASQITGWRYDDAIGAPIETVFRILDPDTKDPLPNPVVTVLKDAKPVSLPGHPLMVTRDNVERHVTDSGAPIIDHDGALLGAILVFRDVTDNLMRERQLRQSQKMEAVGQLASGIAHDFNNLLVGIVGNASLLELELQGDPAKLKVLGGITEAAENATRTVRQLLSFSHRGQMGISQISLHETLRTGLDLIAHTFEKRISVETDLRAGHDTVTGDGPMLQQVVLNLAINARDAMPEGPGTLTLQTATVEIRGGTAPGPADGAYLKLDVSDTGTGIAPEQIDRIFDPFFTTKSAGKGSGIGLATVYGTVQKMGGHISVQSRQGEGTTFTLLLPLCASTPVTQEPSTPVLAEGHGTVLVADDNAGVREILRRGLTKMEYNSVLHETGEDALAWFRDHADVPVLVILDINMPGMGGVACFKDMRKIRSDIRCLFITGYVDTDLSRDLYAAGAVGTLAKPFRMHELSRQIAQALASAPRAARAG